MSDDDDVEIAFPFEVVVPGTPVSSQGSSSSKNKWKEYIQERLSEALPGHKFATTELLSLTIYDFPETLPQGDVDNIVKLIQDALTTKLYQDDKQIRRVVAQRFLPADYENLESPPALVSRALVNDPPFVYIHVKANPMEDAK